MKTFFTTMIVLATLAVNLQAGKIVWGDDGRPVITGPVGQGCTHSGFATEDENTTKSCG